MATSRALLLIGDIGGFARFTRLHRLSLAHARPKKSAARRLALTGGQVVRAVLYLVGRSASSAQRIREPRT